MMNKHESHENERVPFLDQPLRRQSHLWSFKRYLIDAVLVLILTGMCTAIISTLNDFHHSYRAIPGLDVRYKYQNFTSMFESPYYLDADASWKALLSPMKIRVSSEELYQQDQHPESFSLPDGGYLAWLGVFHDLHCLDYIRESLGGRNDTVHFYHCVDHLRQMVMCKPDIETLSVFEWEKQPVFSKYFARRHCVDWERLMDSIANRQVSWEEIDRLRTEG